MKTVRRDAYALAKLRLVGAVPAAYIYPVETQPVRDLLRRRLHLVQVRAGENGSLRRLLLRQGILSSRQQELKPASETELEQWFAHPRQPGTAAPCPSSMNLNYLQCDASRRARLAVWCSSLTGKSQAEMPSHPSRAWFHHAAASDSNKSRVR
ncbi:MAG TPA: hypothetical protein VN643_17695 [Pyrinomonadaceae bacterium]|nr:hypothetical protein [Pyrinomonadaceae bacterium]